MGFRSIRTQGVHSNLGIGLRREAPERDSQIKWKGTPPPAPRVAEKSEQHPLLPMSRDVWDSCVLADGVLGPLLLRLACAVELPFKPLWSKRILKEVYRIQTGSLDWEPRRAMGFRASLSDQYPTNRVVGYERYLPLCQNGESGQHVLACALAARADKIVTYSPQYFTAEQLAPWAGRVLHPDDYLLELYLLFPECILRELRAHEVATEELLATLAPHAPEFAKAVLADETHIDGTLH